MPHREITRPRALARFGGVLYLIIIVIGIFGEVLVRGRVVVPGDAAATAANLGSMAALWRFGIAAELVLLMCAVALLLIFFVLLRPVSRELALLAVFFNLISIGLEAAATLHLVEALFPQGNGAYLRAFEPAQLNAMAYLSVRSFDNGFAVSLAFFGCVCLLLGYLIFRSGFLPQALGVVFPAILLPAFIGETSLCLWLIAKGVLEDRWRQTAAGSL